MKYNFIALVGLHWALTILNWVHELRCAVGIEYTLDFKDSTREGKNISLIIFHVDYTVQ